MKTLKWSTEQIIKAPTYELYCIMLSANVRQLKLGPRQKTTYCECFAELRNTIDTIDLKRKNLLLDKIKKYQSQLK